MDGAGGGRDTERPHPSRDTHQQHPPSGSVRRQERRCTTTATARDGIEPHGCDYLEASPRTSTTTAPAATTSTLLPGHSHLTLTSTSPTTAPRELDKLNLDRHEDEPRRCRRWMRRNWAVFPWVFNAIFRKGQFLSVHKRNETYQTPSRRPLVQPTTDILQAPGRGQRHQTAAHTTPRSSAPTNASKHLKKLSAHDPDSIKPVPTSRLSAALDDDDGATPQPTGLLCMTSRHHEGAPSLSTTKRNDGDGREDEEGGGDGWRVSPWTCPEARPQLCNLRRLLFSQHPLHLKVPPSPSTVNVEARPRQGYTGATVCASESTCVKLNDWYYQCQ
ncbi:hypothetical protein DFP72DRAFT_1067976 [Ephemerocybe angulata]|uniref:CBM1 domain-containing protein n=1 Tax=Ephemerocybe angulata TaxID=980116 RepID=A0A8H6HXK6_9AGAR|nr:hypothetical protein DFP72DRAFT_1067976 [Tulosesus angulatus]